MEIHGALKFIDFVIIALYIVVLLAIGFWVSFRKKHTRDLFLAGNTLGWLNIGFSIFGTNVSPSMLIASCSIAYTSGLIAANFEWHAWIFLLLLGMVFVPHYLNTKISTMPQFMSKRFGQSCREFLSWYTMLATIIMWLGGTLYAGGILLGQIFNWPLWLSLLFLITIATSFTVTGGLAAVVITDSFQSILMIVASAVLTFLAFLEVGGIGNLIETVPSGYWKIFQGSESAYPWYAVLLGYPVMSIWFWCAAQTIDQRVLGARNLRQAQLGTIFTGFLKIVTPFIFLLPGVLCFVLHPKLDDPDRAYMTLVTTCLPNGMIGLIVAVLIAALISTVDSGLNSLSTVFTLDIYLKRFRPAADTREVILVGRIATVAAAVIAFFSAWSMVTIGKNLFDLLQGLIAFLAPPISAVFILGVLWKRATSKAALTTLIFGSILSLTVGVCNLKSWPNKEFWPHFLVVSFLLFAVLILLMIVVSLLTEKPAKEFELPKLRETYASQGHSAKSIWVLWVVLASVMVSIYLIFN